MSDEPKTAIHQEEQLHQKSEAEPWNHHLGKKRRVLICKGCQNFAQRSIPSDNGGKEVEPIEKSKGRNHQTMEAKKSNQLRKEEEKTKTAVNDKRNFAPRLKELVSEDSNFKPTHQTMCD